MGLFSNKKDVYDIDGPVKIGMVGRFDKNQEDLVLAGVELKRRGIAFEIHFVGAGKERQERSLRGLVEKAGMERDVIWRGTISHDCIEDFYLEMDICASTMKREGLS